MSIYSGGVQCNIVVGRGQTDARCEPVYGLDAASFTTCKESVHAHYVTSCRTCRVFCAAACRRVIGPGPWNVAVGVVLQFDGGRLCVRFCFEVGSSGLCALGECGGEEGGEWVREQGFDFRGVQHRLYGEVHDIGRTTKIVRVRNKPGGCCRE